MHTKNTSLVDTSTLKVTLDNQIVSYNGYLESGKVWIITVMYTHSAHTIRVYLDSDDQTQPDVTNQSETNPISGIFGNQIFLIAIIGALIAIIMVLIIANRRKKPIAK